MGENPPGAEQPWRLVQICRIVALNGFPRRRRSKSLVGAHLTHISAHIGAHIGAHPRLAFTFLPDTSLLL